MNDAPRVLLLPGWLDSGPAHWQTRWEIQHANSGATAHSAGAAGHINGESGLGDWPAGLARLQALGVGTA